VRLEQDGEDFNYVGTIEYSPSGCSDPMQPYYEDLIPGPPGPAVL
jgi:hypothetical protein